jgi:uncharacterized membrane protein required for colicin V production
MTWFDIVLVVIFVLGLFLGLKTGLIGAAILAAGVIVGWLLAGQLAVQVGGIFDGSPVGDTWVTVVSYVVIIGVSVLIFRIVGKIAKPFLVIGTLGAASMGDRLGGLAMGLVIGLALAAAAITMSARLAYNFTPLPDVPGASKVIPTIEDKIDFIENGLKDSAVVPVFLDIRGMLPENSLGFIPSDFNSALDELESEIDAAGA